MSQRVTVGKRPARHYIYHTRECSHYPDSPKQYALDALDERWEHCDYCRGDPPRGGEKRVHECPFCGDDVQRFDDHLPCEDSP
jgi:hypothetical protein